MQITIIICTRNRASMLRCALQSLVVCAKPGDAISCEVLVVDNGSNDDTRFIVDEFRTSLPLRTVREEKLGLSNARNRGVQEARGIWTLWIDDDVTVDSQWLRAYADAITRYPDAAVLGGPIIIQFEENPPAWLSEGVEWAQDAYAGRSSTKFRGMVNEREGTPYGANFGLRTTVAKSTPFDPKLGRHPLRPMTGGEETKVIRTILLSGKGYWVPDARVVHHIDRSRQTTEYLRSYYANSGLQMSYKWKSQPFRNRLKSLCGAVVKACYNQMKYIVLCLIQDNKFRLCALRYAASNWGYVKGCIGTLTGTEKYR
jgi:hypothetical protein